MVSSNDPPHDLLGFSICSRSGIRARISPKSAVLAKLKTLQYLQNSQSREKQWLFFKKVKISANSCDEQKLTIPENEKLSFVKHSFTTELSRPDTTFSTKIVTAPDLWALTFHFFEILIFKTFSSNLRLQEILRKRSFWLHLPSFWLDLVTEIHWYLARSEKCFLKIMFSRLESVCVTQLHWLK